VTAPNTPTFSFDPELKRKLLFTLLALVIYRTGAHIAAPGVNVQALSDFIRNSAAAGFFGLYDMLGGGLSRATVFALGIMPYISASIIFQLVGGVVPTISKMQKEEEGRKTITQWTRYATVFISFAQAYTFTLFTESIPGAVANPNFVSRLVMVVTLTVGAIIWATGWRPYDADKIQPYGHDRIDNVVSSVEFERMLDPFGPTGGKIVRPSDGKEAKNVAFIQCAGSRDRNHLKHCSRICCMATLKQTTYLREKFADDFKASVYYIDIRAIDRIDDFYVKVKEDPNVSFIKSKVASITLDKATGNPILHGVDTEGYHRYSNPHDLVVLAVGMEPSVAKSDFPIAVTVNDNGFIEADEANGGIFAAGCSSDALDVNRAVQSATASALRAIQVVNRVARAEG